MHYTDMTMCHGEKKLQKKREEKGEEKGDMPGEEGGKKKTKRGQLCDQRKEEAGCKSACGMNPRWKDVKEGSERGRKIKNKLAREDVETEGRRGERSRGARAMSWSEHHLTGPAGSLPTPQLLKTPQYGGQLLLPA